MSYAKKIACLGGGSLYFPFALPDIVMQQALSGSEVVLYDLELEKAERMAAMGRRLAADAGTGMTVRAAATLADALDGTDYALSSIGGSGAEITPDVYSSYYHAADVRICAEFGVQQVVGDTCGPAGMMMGLRSIPAYLQICHAMEKYCPQAILLNHSNPMAPLCRAMRKYSGINVIGICHGVQGGIAHAGRLLDIPAHELSCTWIGTNHYYWFTSVKHRGVDVYPQLKARMAELWDSPTPQQMTHQLSKIYDHCFVYPQDDHIVEFYPFLTQAPSVDVLPYQLSDAAHTHGNAGQAVPATPGHVSSEDRSAFFEKYQAILDQTMLPDATTATLNEDIGGMLRAFATGERHVCIVNVPNQGSIPNLPATALVEVEGVTDATGVRPLVMGEAPMVLKGILEKRFVWQELVADAGATGSRAAALQAMMVDEQAIWPDKAAALLDALLAASKDLLPQFTTAVG